MTKRRTKRSRRAFDDEQQRVTLLSPSGRRKFYVMRWIDDQSQPRQKTTGTTRRREAERIRLEFEAQLAQGFGSESETWATFRHRYETEHGAGLAGNTNSLWGTVVNWVEREIQPFELADIREKSLSKMVKKMREKHTLSGDPKKDRMKPCSENTIAIYMRALAAAIGWAYDQKMISRIPVFPKLVRVRKSRMAKGRPITTEEFERMQEACPSPAWKRTIKGIWLSGFRLNEALGFHWEDRANITPVDVDGKRPMLYIPADEEKGHQDRILPITPDFAMFLRETPKEERKGYILAFPGRRGRLKLQAASAQISKFGKAKKIVVNKTKDGVKYASAHDLRRSFGDRWSRLVMPPILQQLMRHEDFATTMTFYVGRDAERLADDLWKVAVTELGDTLGDTAEISENRDLRKS